MTAAAAAPGLAAPGVNDVLKNLSFFFGEPAVPEKLRDYSEHHAMTCKTPNAPFEPHCEICRAVADARFPVVSQNVSQITFPVRGRCTPPARSHTRTRTVSTDLVFCPDGCTTSRRLLRTKYKDSRHAQQSDPQGETPLIPRHRNLDRAEPPSSVTYSQSPQEWQTQVALPFVRIEGTQVEWDEMRFDVRLLQRVPVRGTITPVAHRPLTRASSSFFVGAVRGNFQDADLVASKASRPRRSTWHRHDDRVQFLCHGGGQAALQRPAYVHSILCARDGQFRLPFCVLDVVQLRLQVRPVQGLATQTSRASGNAAR